MNKYNKYEYKYILILLFVIFIFISITNNKVVEHIEVEKVDNTKILEKHAQIFATTWSEEILCNLYDHQYIDGTCKFSKKTCIENSNYDRKITVEPSDPRAPPECINLATINPCNLNPGDYEEMKKNYCTISKIDTLGHDLKYLEWIEDKTSTAENKENAGTCVKNINSLTKELCVKNNLEYYEGSRKCTKDGCEYTCMKDANGQCITEEVEYLEKQPDGSTILKKETKPIPDIPNCILTPEYCSKYGLDYSSSIMYDNQGKPIELGSCGIGLGQLISESFLGVTSTRKFKQEINKFQDNCISENPFNPKCAIAFTKLAFPGIVWAEIGIATTLKLYEDKFKDLKSKCNSCVVEDTSMTYASECVMACIDMFPGVILTKMGAGVLDGIFGMIPGYPSGLMTKGVDLMLDAFVLIHVKLPLLLLNKIPYFNDVYKATYKAAILIGAPVFNAVSTIVNESIIAIQDTITFTGDAAVYVVDITIQTGKALIDLCQGDFSSALKVGDKMWTDARDLGIKGAMVIIKLGIKSVKFVAKFGKDCVNVLFTLGDVALDALEKIPFIGGPITGALKVMHDFGEIGAKAIFVGGEDAILAINSLGLDGAKAIAGGLITATDALKGGAEAVGDALNPTSW